MVDWFQGYVLGNPMTDRSSNDNYKIPFAYGMALISNELYKVINYLISSKKTTQLVDFEFMYSYSVWFYFILFYFFGFSP